MSDFWKQVLKNFFSTIVFALCYALISYLHKEVVEIDTLISTAALYFVFMCLLCFIAPKLRKITGHKQKQ